ncbi:MULTISPECIES: hypothetical protein [unclassified Comamonas]|uniref:hypothetical protein n=1 Tax=unclassified Comamonas TaxID=2638500 RepID=UPI0004120F00|nr:hypothetical protein [Comamonas sp. B-9]
MRFSFPKPGMSVSGMGLAGVYAAACLFVLFVNGALPFVGIPTLGQAVWTTGFSHSFANESMLSIHAHNFGAPHPAAMAFGLAGAWLAGVFISLGLHAADAYALMVAFWLALAFWGAYQLSRAWDVSASLSILAALAWGTMPMVWNHVAYSMLSTGIALLPFYVWAAWRFFNAPFASAKGKAALYALVCVLSIFMDGYSFMMFAVAASIVAIAAYWRKTAGLAHLLVHGLCFAIAYVLFALYIGKGQYSAANLDFFRGWGADISFFLIPSKGVHWLADLMGWSRARSMNEYFGDTSVWITTFCLPLLVFATVFCFLLKSQYKYPLMVVALFGFYMAMGPSLKFNSVKPSPETPDLMEARYAIAPTGSGLLSENLPGFKNMRASYRWGALGFFGAWALMVVALSGKQRRGLTTAAALSMLCITALNLPDLPKKYVLYKAYRSQFMQIDHDLVLKMGDYLKPREKVVFLPWRNDFLVNYVAGKLNIVTYNVGGDKNYEDARPFWPGVLKAVPQGTSPEDFSIRVTSLLMNGDADAVVVPYIDMLWAAHRWPYPASEKMALAPKIQELKDSAYVSVTEEALYAAVRLKAGGVSAAQRQEFAEQIQQDYCLEQRCLKVQRFSKLPFTQVGRLQDDQLVSSGKAGFMHFGPYAPMESGDYLLQVRGEAPLPAGAWVDVVSGNGSLNHGKFLIGQPDASRPGVLVQEPIHLANAVQDLEIRLYVSANTQLSLAGYDMKSFNRAGQH